MVIIGFTDLEMKNHKPNQTRLVSIGSDQFQTEPNKVGYFFGLVRFELLVLLALSEPLTPLPEANHSQVYKEERY